MENIKEKEHKIKLKTIKLRKYFFPKGKKQNKNKFSLSSQKKKIKNEIESMSNENRNIFREALNKYSFETEVFIPSSLRISKKEYKNKNYLLNTLISFEDKLNEQKEFITPIKNETNRFSKQYKLIQEENGGHQRNYLNNLQKYYEGLGYSRSGLEFSRSDNIFSPSSILDQDFGNNIQKDAYRYGNAEYRKDYLKDRILLKKFGKSVKETKDNKNRAKNRDLREDQKEEVTNIKEDILRIETENLIQREKEKKREEMQKELEQIKKNLIEEDRIRNMNKEEYFNYNLELKNDIKRTKESLKEFNNINSEDAHLNRRYSVYNLKYSFSPESNKLSIDSNKRNNFVLSEKKNKKRNSIICKSTNFVNIFLNRQSPISITENNVRPLDRLTTCVVTKKKDFLPKINTINVNKETEAYDPNDDYMTKLGKIQSQKLRNKMIQFNELDNLYKSIYNNKKYFFERYPSKNVEEYFKKFTNKRISTLDFKKGSNIHGLLDDLQHIVKKSDFSKIVVSNSDVKREMNHKNEYSPKKMLDDKKFDVVKIQEMDVKIPDLHYQFAEDLLTDKDMDNFIKKHKKGYI